MTDLEKELLSLEPAAPADGFEARLEESLGEAGNVAIKRTSPRIKENDVPAGGRATFVSWIAPLAIAAAVACIIGA